MDLEKDLIIKISGSDGSAFKEIYLKYFSKIYNYIYYRTGSEELSKDLVQEVFTRIWNTREKLDPAQIFSAYIYRIASNLTIDHLRKSSLRKQTDIDTVPGSVASNPEYEYDLREGINKTLEDLPEDQRLVFIMNRYEGYKQREIAEILDISIRTVENRICKAMNFMRENLKENLGQ